jgi:DNA segregation ATPase FtsK/SpoIIIE, S-DNA-T family
MVMRDPDKRRSGSGSSARRSRGSTAAATPPKGTGRKRVEPESEPDPEWRRAVAGREEELLGIGLIALGILLGFGVYLRLAGPLGRAVDQVLGWLLGWGRFLLPVALIAVGVALIHKGVSSHRLRLVFGWSAMALSVLGMLHIVRGPDTITMSVSALEGSGGWIGAVVGEPVRSLISGWGAAVLFLALFVGGFLLVTRSTLRELGSRTRQGVEAVAYPVGRATRRVFGNMSTLSSDRPSGEAPSGASNAVRRPAAPGALRRGCRRRGRRGPQAATPRRRPATAVTVDTGPGQQAELDLGPGAQRGKWTLPPASFLVCTGNQVVDRAEVESRGGILEESLASHGVETRLVGMTSGPTVTRYELELGPGVKVARVTSLQRDIAYALAATDVRILAPIPGKSAIGVEVPNRTRQLVSLGDILASSEAKAAVHPLDVALGKDIAGRSVFLNLATTPHLLIAGTTGSGKSSGLNCIITSMLMRATPDQVRLILIDPKQVEMGQYSRLPHLLTEPVTNPKKAANALAWAVKEMERRYDLLVEVGFRDITGYNAAFDRGELAAPTGRPTSASDLFDDEAPTPPAYERIPYIVVVVDELNDLMMVAARDVEESITRIAQKARAVGIHLIVATQRPSVNVITGVIKANVPARAAFAVSSLTDSRVILDQPGAEKLVGNGDMLLLPGSSSVSQRIQGSWVSEDEVRKVVNHWRHQAPEVTYVPGVGEDTADDPSGVTSGYGSSSTGDDDDDEALLKQAMELVVRSQLGSTSMLQRKLKVGFARAGRIMDLLEQRGVVGPSEGSKARAVLMTVEEFELIQDDDRNR